MKSYGPKALIELPGHETIIGRQLRVLRSRFPTADIVVVVGHEADRVIKTLPRNIKVVENENYANTNVVRSIGMGLRVASRDRVLLVYGDLVFNTGAIEWAGEYGSSILVDTRGQMGEDEVGVTVYNGRATNFSYGLPVKWSQIAFLAGRELELFKEVVWDSEKRRCFGFEALNAVLDEGGKLRAVEPHGARIREIDSSKDIDQVDNVSKYTIIRI